MGEPREFDHVQRILAPIQSNYSLTWRGVDDVLKRLETLPALLVAKCLKPAIEKSARVVARAMKAALTRHRTGYLKASIGIRVSPSWKSGRVYAVIGPRKSASTAKGIKTVKVWRVKRDARRGGNTKVVPTRYAHLVEFGHAKGRGHGAARAHPFMRPAWAATKLSAEQIAANEIRRSVARLVTGA
jgi:HK97 gp10 family phage protein